jgi:hypothetical protein
MRGKEGVGSPPQPVRRPIAFPAKRHWERRQSRWHLDAADGFAVLVRLLSEAKCLNAASRRLGLSRNWTPALFVRDRDGQGSLAYIYYEDGPGRPINSLPARAKGAIGRLDFHFAFVLRPRGEPECAARGLNNRTASPLVWIIHKLVEPNL